MTRSFRICVRHIFSGDQIKKAEMSRAFSTYGGEEGCRHGFGGGT